MCVLVWSVGDRARAGWGGDLGGVLVVSFSGFGWGSFCFVFLFCGLVVGLEQGDG